MTTTPPATPITTGANSGPRPEAQKTGPKFNRLSHGLTSASPVIPGESPADWDDHRTGLLHSLGPVGPLERELAERIASLLWRLRRVVRYETAATTAALDRENAPPTDWTDARTATARHDHLPDPTSTAGWRNDLHAAHTSLDHIQAAAVAFRALAGRPDTHRLRGSATGRMIEIVCRGFCRIDLADPTLTDGLGLPKGPALGRWKKWTVGLVRAVFARIGVRLNRTEDQVRVEIGRWLDRETTGAREWVDRAEQGLAKAEAADRAWDAEVLIEEVTNKVARYEAHLNRQLKTTYQLLRQMQADRTAADGLAREFGLPGWGMDDRMGGRDAGFSGGSDGLPEIVVIPRRSATPSTPVSDQAPSKEPVAPAGEASVVSADQTPKTEAGPTDGPNTVSTDQTPKTEAESAGEPSARLSPTDPVEISTDQAATEGRMDPTRGEWVDVTGPAGVAVAS